MSQQICFQEIHVVVDDSAKKQLVFLISSLNNVTECEVGDSCMDKIIGRACVSSERHFGYRVEFYFFLKSQTWFVDSSRLLIVEKSKCESKCCDIINSPRLLIPIDVGEKGMDGIYEDLKPWFGCEQPRKHVILMQGNWLILKTNE